MGSLVVAVVGCGLFAKNFVPLFKAHPEVKKVYVCDDIQERAEEYAKNFDVEIIPTYEDVLADEKVNCVAIFTQRYLHGRMVIKALNAGKHVYSAVPCAIKVDEIVEIERLVRKTGLTYSMGETGYYRAPTCFLRREYEKGTFGEFVWGSAQYNHDMRAMEDPFKHTGGDEWKKHAGIPPFFYPTHSTAMILGSMPGVYVKKVVGMGYESTTRKDLYGREGQNFFNNPFANTSMLMYLSNGGVARVSENRCVGWKAPETYISQFYGTEGGYEFSVAKHFLSTWDNSRKARAFMKDVSEELTPTEVTELLNSDFDKGIQEIADGYGFYSTSPVQETARLPQSFSTITNGHNGTHHFIIDDFCKAAATGKLSPTNIWQVARFNIPGLIAHESAMNGSVPMDIPDLGDAPAGWEKLDAYAFDYNQK